MEMAELGMTRVRMGLFQHALAHPEANTERFESIQAKLDELRSYLYANRESVRGYAEAYMTGAKHIPTLFSACVFRCHDFATVVEGYVRMVGAITKNRLEVGCLPTGSQTLEIIKLARKERNGFQSGE
jgi:hypothetical protein